MYIFEEFIEHIKKVAQMSMFKISGTIRSNDMKAAMAVNYAMGILVKDNCNRQPGLINRKDCETVRNQLEIKLQTIVSIVKHCLESVVTTDDTSNYDLHSMKFAFKKMIAKERAIRSLAKYAKEFLKS